MEIILTLVIMVMLSYIGQNLGNKIIKQVYAKEISNEKRYKKIEDKMFDISKNKLCQMTSQDLNLFFEARKIVIAKKFSDPEYRKNIKICEEMSETYYL